MDDADDAGTAPINTAADVDIFDAAVADDAVAEDSVADEVVAATVETLSARRTTRSMGSSRFANEAVADEAGTSSPPPLPCTLNALTVLTDAVAARGKESRDKSGGKCEADDDADDDAPPSADGRVGADVEADAEADAKADSAIFKCWSNILGNNKNQNQTQ